MCSHCSDFGSSVLRVASWAEQRHLFGSSKRGVLTSPFHAMPHSLSDLPDESRAYCAPGAIPEAAVTLVTQRKARRAYLLLREVENFKGIVCLCSHRGDRQVRNEPSEAQRLTAG